MVYGSHLCDFRIKKPAGAGWLSFAGGKAGEANGITGMAARAAYAAFSERGHGVDGQIAMMCWPSLLPEGKLKR
jgi:hypothetical protein